ncbi:MAG TPA: hypothetical protein VNF68_08045 [Candidatus Baltobacteraceae bacterium]|nr:hypothetical protein [Candidatus Baltobacteraceae bacterium]
MNDALVARIVWWLAGLVFVGGGIGWVWWPASTQIAAVRESAQELYDEANADEADVRRAATLRSARARIAADVGALAGQTSSGAATAAALRLLSAQSKQFGVELRSVTPQEVQPTMHAPTPRLARDTLIPMDIAVGLRGNFRNVVKLLSDLPRHEALLALRDVSLQATGALHAGGPTLDVTVHAILYRIGDKATTEGTYAAGASR